MIVEQNGGTRILATSDEGALIVEQNSHGVLFRIRKEVPQAEGGTKTQMVSVLVSSPDALGVNDWLGNNLG